MSVPFPFPHRAIGAFAPSEITWSGSQESQHTSERMKSSAAVSMPAPLSFYCLPKAYKSLESINSMLIAGISTHYYLRKEESI